MAGQVKDHGVGALTALISGGAVALIGEIFKNAVTEGLKSGGVAFWLTMIAAALAMIVAYISSYNYSVIFRDYGRDSADDDERAVFDSLRTRLAAGGRFMPIYNDLLTRGLDRVDRFFGDADPAVKTLWPGAFGFKGAKPFWTAPAYDRCLLIALLYPLAVLFVVWGVSGEVGKAEGALGLVGDTKIFQRVVFLCSFSIFVVTLFLRSNVKTFISFLVLNAISLISIILILYSTSFLIAAIIFCVFLITTLNVINYAGYIYYSIIFLMAIISFFKSFFLLGAITFGFFIGIFKAYFVGADAYVKKFVDITNDKTQRKKINYAGFSVIIFSIIYGNAAWFGDTNGWDQSGPLLLFFGVLTLVNAPFDWMSVGLTRALLRRGVEAGGFAPVWLALLDLVLATLLIVVLAIVTVFFADLFEVVGRSKIIDVAGVLDGLADPVRRRETQYWWIYATLFSTLIPSVLNMTVAALSLMRGVPWFHKRVAAAMRPGKPMMDIHLSWMPGALALEVMLAAMAGLAFTYWWIFKAVPWLTRPVEWLIPMLRWVAGWV